MSAVDPQRYRRELHEPDPRKVTSPRPGSGAARNLFGTTFSATKATQEPAIRPPGLERASSNQRYRGKKMKVDRSRPTSAQAESSAFGFGHEADPGNTSRKKNSLISVQYTTSCTTNMRSHQLSWRDFVDPGIDLDKYSPRPQSTIGSPHARPAATDLPGTHPGQALPTIGRSVNQSGPLGSPRAAKQRRMQAQQLAQSATAQTDGEALRVLGSNDCYHIVTEEH